MRKRVCRLFATLGVFAMLMASVPVRAQSTTVVGRVNIPFSFIINNRTIPAGEYTIERPLQGTDQAILIRRGDGRAIGMFLTHSVQTSASSDLGKLVFHRYGDQYFLSQVWTGGDNVGLELTRSRRERVLQREMAARAADYQSVTLATNRR